MKIKSLFFTIVCSVSSCMCDVLESHKVNCSDEKQLNITYEEYRNESSRLFSYYVERTLNENVKGNLMEAAHNSSDKLLEVDDILPEDKSHYLRRRPPTICGRPAIVTYQLTVISLDTINEAAMTYSLDAYLTVAWIDHRLRLPNSSRDYLILDPSWLKDVWQPDTVFKNAREVVFHERIIPNHYLWMLPNKALVYVAKLTLSLTCSMDFSYYPHDTQECDMRMESLMYTTKELVLGWDAKIPITFLTKNSKIVTPQFRSVHNETQICTIPYLTGSYSCIRAVFYLRRSLGYHLIHTYFPSGLIVVLSWVTFWIKIKDIMPRIGLGVTTLLTMATLSSQSQASLPPVSYRKAIDIWMTICAIFVFSSIIEFAIVNYIVSRFPDDESILTSEPKNPKTCKEKLRAYFSHRQIYIMAHNVDKVCRLLFPALFLALNIWYWSTYLQEDEINGNKVPDDEI
ncbi:glycine receptor subunit alphaZ1-like [Planococcus citri]|uniref:glycine receptor subunit alphaZ1-like n=1 Tax=Planococcus citri TaxID=170843 RepID=UPI0031F77D8F